MMVACNFLFSIKCKYNQWSLPTSRLSLVLICSSLCYAHSSLFLQIIITRKLLRSCNWQMLSWESPHPRTHPATTRNVTPIAIIIVAATTTYKFTYTWICEWKRSGLPKTVLQLRAIQDKTRRRDDDDAMRKKQQKTLIHSMMVSF